MFPAFPHSVPASAKFRKPNGANFVLYLLQQHVITPAKKPKLFILYFSRLILEESHELQCVYSRVLLVTLGCLVPVFALLASYHLSNNVYLCLSSMVLCISVCMRSEGWPWPLSTLWQGFASCDNNCLGKPDCCRQLNIRHCLVKLH